MGSLTSSIDLNKGGCPCEPHKPSVDSPAERAAMRKTRVSGATGACDEHVTHRLIHGIPPDNHAQRIQAQVRAYSDILANARGASSGA